MGASSWAARAVVRRRARRRSRVGLAGSISAARVASSALGLRKVVIQRGPVVQTACQSPVGAMLDPPTVDVVIAHATCVRASLVARWYS